MKVVRNGLLPEKKRTWLDMAELEVNPRFQEYWHRLIQKQLITRESTIT